MSDATLMMRMDRGRGRGAAKQVDGWFMNEGPVEDHYKVWPLIAVVAFPCIGALLVGFDMGGCAWMVNVSHNLCDPFIISKRNKNIKSHRSLASVHEVIFPHPLFLSSFFPSAVSKNHIEPIFLCVLFIFIEFLTI
jgi:hypothetical protein